MYWNRSTIVRILRKVLLFIVITATTTSLAYFGVKWWLKYANTEAFKGEVNAAIITGIMTVITLVVTTWFNWYTAYRNQKAILREELFRRRLEVYQDIMQKLLEMKKVTEQFFITADPTLPPRIVELGKNIHDMYTYNQYLFSFKTHFRLQAIQVVWMAFEEVQNDLDLNLSDVMIEDLFHYKPEGIVSAEDYWKNGLAGVFVKAFWQLYRDSGFETILDELDELIL